MLPSVGVVVVTHQRRSQVMELLDSIAAQTRSPDEIVVVDNASDDGTAEAVQASHPTARLVRSDVNLGCSSGKNLGVRAARSDWVFCIDDDATVPPQFIEECGAAIARWPDAAVIGGFVTDELRGPPVGRVEGLSNAFHGGAMGVHRDTFLAVGGLVEGGYYGEERDFGYRLRSQSDRPMVRVPAIWINHHPEVSSDRSRRRQRLAARQGIESAVRFAPAWAIAPLVAWRIAQHLRTGARAACPGAAMEGVRDGLATVPTTWRQREPVSIAAIIAVRSRARNYEPATETASEGMGHGPFFP